MSQSFVVLGASVLVQDSSDEVYKQCNIPSLDSPRKPDAPT
nr:13179_t:CDS:2 [Entrophospora candida]CAG8469382.1 273_t:CDS:2 [Entrophospora candida]